MANSSSARKLDPSPTSSLVAERPKQTRVRRRGDRIVSALILAPFHTDLKSHTFCFSAGPSSVDSKKALPPNGDGVCGRMRARARRKRPSSRYEYALLPVSPRQRTLVWLRQMIDYHVRWPSRDNIAKSLFSDSGQAWRFARLSSSALKRALENCLCWRGNLPFELGRASPLFPAARSHS